MKQIRNIIFGFCDVYRKLVSLVGCFGKERGKRKEDGGSDEMKNDFTAMPMVARYYPLRDK